MGVRALVQQTLSPSCLTLRAGRSIPHPLLTTATRDGSVACGNMRKRFPMKIPITATLAFAVGAAVFAAAGSADAGGVTVAVDTDPAGNTVRSVGAIDDCRSLAVGDSAVVDIVLPSPGVPPSSGLSAYQFSLLYDPALVSVTASAPGMLIDQASASNVIYLSDPLPDTNGIYVSWAVDFGPTAPEPSGASETGPGVLARLTLQGRAAGTAELTLIEVQLIDSESNQIALSPNQNARLEIGATCPGEEPTAAPNVSPSPAPAAGSGSDGESGGGGNTSPSYGGAGEGGSAAVPQTGGPPAAGNAGLPLAMIAFGLIGIGAIALGAARFWSE